MRTDCCSDAGRWQQGLGLVLCCVILVGVLLGQTAVRCGTWQYWLVTLSSLPLLAAVSFYFARQRKERGWQKLVWTGMGFMAGLCAALLGIGGGMIKGPLMLQMGTLPQVAVATSSFMILFTSAATTFNFLLLERLRFPHISCILLVPSCIFYLVTSVFYLLSHDFFHVSSIS